jgi:hypothetical protein
VHEEGQPTGIARSAGFNPLRADPAELVDSPAMVALPTQQLCLQERALQLVALLSTELLDQLRQSLISRVVDELLPQVGERVQHQASVGFGHHQPPVGSADELLMLRQIQIDAAVQEEPTGRAKKIAQDQRAAAAVGWAGTSLGADGALVVDCAGV